LFVALHLIHAQIPQDVPPGVPYHLVPRILLETCDTVWQAVSTLLKMPHLYAFNYLVADCDDMCAVEAYPGRVRARTSNGQCLVVTNYYARSDMRSLQGRRRLASHEARVRWIEQRADEDRIPDAAEWWPWAQRLLRDHSVPMCHHRPTQATLWAMVADLTSRRVAYCLGAPCRNEFEAFEWPGRDGQVDD
jgi:hypothetical protein